MLVGRESLVRLIGKRRRFLPNRHRLLHPATDTSKPAPENAGNDEPHANRIQVATPTSQHNEGNPDLVDCPVCGQRLQSQDYAINAHLDACLTRGRKRKLTQLTLLQFKRHNIEHASTLHADHTGDKLLKRIFNPHVAISAVVDSANKNECEIISKSIQCENSGSSNENQGVAFFESDTSVHQGDYALDNKISRTCEINYKSNAASSSPNVEMSSCSSIEIIIDLVTESVHLTNTISQIRSIQN